MKQSPISDGLLASLQRVGRLLRISTPSPSVGEGARRVSAVASQQRSNRAAAADLDPFLEVSGAGTGWARPEYGNCYASSTPV